MSHCPFSGPWLYPEHFLDPKEHHQFQEGLGAVSRALQNQGREASRRKQGLVGFSESR